MIVTAGALPQRHRDLIIALAAQHKLPTVYFERSFVTAGGLVSYGASETDQYRRAASYVDRILKGEKPSRRQAHRIKGDTVGNLASNLFIADCRLRNDAKRGLMSAIGSWRTCQFIRAMSAFGSKADIA